MYIIATSIRFTMLKVSLLMHSSNGRYESEMFLKEFHSRGSYEYLDHWAKEVDWMTAKYALSWREECDFPVPDNEHSKDNVSSRFDISIRSVLTRRFIRVVGSDFANVIQIRGNLNMRRVLAVLSFFGVQALSGKYPLLSQEL